MMPPMSRHRFNHSVDHNDDTKEAPATARARRIEVITGVERRRQWSAQEKVAIVAESLARGRHCLGGGAPSWSQSAAAVRLAIAFARCREGLGSIV